MKKNGYKILHEKSDNPDYSHTIVYRGYKVPIYLDDAGQQYYCFFDGEEIGFGAYNLCYTDDLKYLIDRKEDKKENKGDSNV